MNKIDLLVKYNILNKFPYFNNRYHAVVLTGNGGYYTIPFSKQLNDVYKNNQSLNVCNCIVLSTAYKSYVCLTKSNKLIDKSYKYRYEHQQDLIEIGNKIHLHSKRGIYTVTNIHWFGIELTTKRANGEKHIVHHSDYKCKAGGRYV